MPDLPQKIIKSKIKGLTQTYATLGQLLILISGACNDSHQLDVYLYIHVLRSDTVTSLPVLE